MVNVLEVLGELVRNVALIVLLAVFVELLLPAGDLSRFVRLVMGLFVLAAMLTSLWQVLPRVVPATANLRPAGVGAGMEEIKRQAQALQRYQETATLDLYRQQLAGQVAALVAGTGELEARRVEVVLEEDRDSGAYGAIRSLAVEVGPRGRQPEIGSSMTPVTVGVGGQAADLATAVDQAKERLTHFYGLTPEQVVIRLVE